MTEEIHTGGLKKFVRKGKVERDLDLEKSVYEAYEKADNRKAKERKRKIIFIIILIVILIILGVIFLR